MAEGMLNEQQIAELMNIAREPQKFQTQDLQALGAKPMEGSQILPKESWHHNASLFYNTEYGKKVLAEKLGMNVTDASFIPAHQQFMKELYAKGVRETQRMKAVSESDKGAQEQKTTVQ